MYITKFDVEEKNMYLLRQLTYSKKKKEHAIILLPRYDLNVYGQFIFFTYRILLTAKVGYLMGMRLLS